MDMLQFRLQTPGCDDHRFLCIADQFFSRVGRDAFVKTAVLPAVSLGVKRGIQALPGLEGAGNLPNMVLAPLIGCIVKVGEVERTESRR